VDATEVNHLLANLNENRYYPLQFAVVSYMRRFARRVTLALCLALSPALAVASPRYALTIHDRAFAPTMLTVPAGVRIRLEVRNARTLPSEFESFDLNREKMVLGGTTVSVWIGPLKPGKYKFFDDFNPGVIGWIVVPASGPETAR
jgi:heme/copper-type cytochrome/quinol oxidase subunit 2